MIVRDRLVSALSASAALLAAFGMTAPQAGATGHTPHSKPVKGSSTTPAPLLYHGGPVLATSKTYAIWWGTPTQFPSDARTGIESLLNGFGGSNYLAIANEYMLGATANSSFVQSLVDTSAPPAHSPSTNAIVGEVAKVLKASGIAPQTNAVYLVYTSNFPHANFCAWHSAGTINGTTVQVGYMPNSSNVAGCDPGNLYGSNSYSEGTRSLADSTAHEFMESTTDPVPLSGWADKNGQEIGDKCNFVYSGTVTLANHSTWQLQEEWSDKVGGCVQGR